MVQSLNTKVDLVMEATAFLGIAQYGEVMIGDKGFEFYDARNPQKFIQIPWDEVNYVTAAVVFGGKWIPRYSFQTKRDGTFSFSSKHPKKVLRAISNYIAPDHMVRSIGFFDVLKNAFRSIIHGKNSEKK
ncbi:DUF956 family protein [Enterococcus hirae]|nr:DUF956 family protein [Enterococcus hirae]